MTRPNRVRPKSGERLGIELGHMVGSSLGGLTRLSTPVPRPGVSPAPMVGVVAVVVHGDDGTVARPIALLVMWVGAAPPSNGADYDLWYPADL